MYSGYYSIGSLVISDNRKYLSSPPCRLDAEGGMMTWRVRISNFRPKFVDLDELANNGDTRSDWQNLLPLPHGHQFFA